MSFTTNGNMHRHARIHEKEGHSMATSHAHNAAASAATASSQPREHTVSVTTLFAGEEKTCSLHVMDFVVATSVAAVDGFNFCIKAQVPFVCFLLVLI